MQYYVIETLLVLNIIGVLYWVVRGSLRQDSPSPEDHHHEILESLQTLKQDIAELKASTETFSLLFKRKSEQWKTERRALQESVQSAVPTDKGQTLFLNDRYKEIFELQKQGLTVDQIARKLEKGSGEIAFILQLASQDTPKKGF